MSAAVLYATRRRTRPRLALLLLTLMLIAGSLVHLGLCARWIAPQTVLQALLEYDPRNFDHRIIVDLRLVRLAAALVTVPPFAAIDEDALAQARAAMARAVSLSASRAE